MSDQPNAQANPAKCSAAAEWGLASLLLGGFLGLLAMLNLQLNLSIYLSPRSWSHNDIRTIEYVAMAGAVVLFFLTAASIAFGIRSLTIAYRRGQPSALGWAGVLVSLFALGLWVFALIDLFSILDMLWNGPFFPGLNVPLPRINLN